MVEVFKVENGLECGRIRAVDGVVERLGLATYDSGGGRNATSARANVDGAVRVVGEDVFSIDKTSLVNRDDRGKGGGLDEKTEGLADVLADGGWGTTRAVDDLRVGIVGDYVGKGSLVRSE